MSTAGNAPLLRQLSDGRQTGSYGQVPGLVPVAYDWGVVVPTPHIW